MEFPKPSLLPFFSGIVLLCACAPKGFDPCDEMMREVKEVRSIEKQMAKTETLIQKDRAAKDTADLNQDLKIQGELRERRKSAQIAAANMGASCLPKQQGESELQEQPLDPNAVGDTGKQVR